jgi:uncharacterized protein YlxP (DUF503 family)
MEGDLRLWLAYLRVTLLLPGCDNLKGRRQAVRSLLEHVRGQNVSTTDLGPEGIVNEAVLAFACAGSSPRELGERLDRIRGTLERRQDEGDFEIVRIEREVYRDDDLSNRTDQ